MRFGIIADSSNVQIMFDRDGRGESVEPTAVFFPPQEPVDEYQAVTVKLLDNLLEKQQFAKDFCLLLQTVYDMGRRHEREESNPRKEVQMEDYDYQDATEEQMRRYREYNCIVELPPEVHQWLDENPGALSGVSWEKGG